MPFTLAHPAITIPLLRLRKVSATGLIVGTMIPDVEYFINMGADCDNLHTLPAVFLSYLPLSVLVSLVFHLFVRDSLINNLPVRFQQRYGSFRNFDFIRYLRQHWFIFLYSVMTGIGLHFLWDHLSHGTMMFEFMNDLYKQKIYIFGKDFSVIMVSQYLHSLAGMLIFGNFISRFNAGKTAPVSRARISYWTTVSLTVIIIMLIRVYTNTDDLTNSDVIISFVSASFMGLLFSGKVEKIRSFFSNLYAEQRSELRTTRQNFFDISQWVVQAIQNDLQALPQTIKTQSPSAAMVEVGRRIDI